jgi:preprotein translocase subunit SecE
MDTVKLCLAVALVLGAIFSYHYFTQVSILYRVLGLLAVGLVSTFAILSTSMGRGFLGFLKESRVEVRRVVWPTRQETVQATLVVVALVFVAGLLLWMLDMVLFKIVTLLTGQGA